MIRPYATIHVPIPGIPVRVTAQELDPSAPQHVHGILIQALPGNTGRMAIGDATLNFAGAIGVFAFLAIPTKNSIPSFQAALTLAPGAIQLRDFYIDAEVAGEGVIVAVLVA